MCNAKVVLIQKTEELYAYPTKGAKLASQIGGNMAESGRKSSRFLILVSGSTSCSLVEKYIRKTGARALIATHSTEVRQLNAPAELQKKRAILGQVHGSPQNGLGLAQ